GINQDEVRAVGFTPSTLQVIDLSSHSKNGAITFPPAKVIMSPARKSTWDNAQWVFKYSDNGKDYFVYPSSEVGPGGTRVYILNSTSCPNSNDNSFSVWVSGDSHVTIHNTYSMFLSNNSWYIESSTPTNQFDPPTSLINASRPSIFTLYRKYDAEQITLDAGGAVCPITKAYGAINALPLVFRIVDDQKQEVYWWEDEEGNHYMPGTRFPTSGAVESPVTLTAVYRTYDIKYKPIEAMTDMQAGDTVALVMEDGDGGNNRFALQIGQGTLTMSTFDDTNVPLLQRIVVVEKDDYFYTEVGSTDVQLKAASFRSGAYPAYNLIRYEPPKGSGSMYNYEFQSDNKASAFKYALYNPNDAFPSRVQIFNVYNPSGYKYGISLVYTPSSNTVYTRQQSNTFTCYYDQFADNKALSEMSSAATWTIYKRHIKYAYPITYNANGGTISPTTVCGWEVTLAAATAPVGYEQIGWATTQANADNQMADAGAVGDTYIADAPITLYAVYKPIVLTLTELASNSELLATYNSQQVAQIDMNRTVTPNQLNTFCVPFDMDEQEIKNVFGADTKLYEIVGADLNGESLTIRFNDVEPMAIAAGYPYLIEPTQTINDELFTMHTINNTLTTHETENVDFIPVFNPTILPAESDILFLGASNLLYRPYTSGQIKGLRAYFHLKNGAQVAQRVVLSSARQIPTALPATNQLTNARKVVHKGQLFIYVNDKIYNAQGIQY
ncbi:MAG: InlB B-repeat-containing protein, partial [Prevotellaceae bacterium]|nr:InlB B-repeat-containing protein [Candidatus Faecinaster equi]